jgi:hypothetical protein
MMGWFAFAPNQERPYHDRHISELKTRASEKGRYGQAMPEV